MEQVVAPDKKPLGPLNKAPIRLFWIPWAPGAHRTPEDEQKGPLETSGDQGLKFGSHWLPWSYMVRPQVKLFCKKRFFLLLKCPPPPKKNSGPNSKSFWFWRGLPWGPLRPLPPLGESWVRDCTLMKQIWSTLVLPNSITLLSLWRYGFQLN